MNRKLEKITIIGLGLIGGSIAKGLRRVYSNMKIVSVDINEKSLDKAICTQVIDIAYKVTNGVIDNAVDSDMMQRFENDMVSSDIIFLCTELNASRYIIDRLSLILNGKNVILTDVFSTKTEISDIFQNTKINYIGGHPMAGSEQSGYAASSEYLLENAMYILCPEVDSKEDDIEFLKNVIKDIGAIPYIMSPLIHDEAMARISHLPHIVAAALVNTAANFPEQEILRTLAAGGFKDITRIASGDPELWKNITVSNRKNVIKAIEDVTEYLARYKKALQQSDKDELHLLFESAQNEREEYETGRKAIMNLMYELNIDVPDRPGIIAEISTKLKDNNINIKNIYIAESRENELGCMRLAFLTKEERDRAEEILSPDKGFKE